MVIQLKAKKKWFSQGQIATRYYHSLWSNCSIMSLCNIVIAYAIVKVLRLSHIINGCRSQKVGIIGFSIQSCVSYPETHG